MTLKHYTCYHCHIDIPSKSPIEKCPKCNKPMQVSDYAPYRLDYSKVETPTPKEGEGRIYGAGGEACNLCPHCHASKGWCPLLD